ADVAQRVGRFGDPAPAVVDVVGRLPQLVDGARLLTGQVVLVPCLAQQRVGRANGAAGGVEGRVAPDAVGVSRPRLLAGGVVAGQDAVLHAAAVAGGGPRLLAARVVLVLALLVEGAGERQELAGPVVGARTLVAQGVDPARLPTQGVVD